MKVKKHDYNELRDAIHNRVNELTREKIKEHKMSLINSNTGDISKKFRWNLLWAVSFPVRQVIVDRIYQYANDNHIDTALKSIIKELEV